MAKLPPDLRDHVRDIIVEGEEPAEGIADFINDALRDELADYTVGMLAALRAYVPLAMEAPDLWSDPVEVAARIQDDVETRLAKCEADPISRILVAEFTMFQEFMDYELIGAAVAMVAVLQKGWGE